MSNRITEKMLETLAQRINKALGTPAEPYAENPDTGRQEPQPGNFHISYAYGGTALHQMMESGGIEDIFRSGHMPKRELFERMGAYLDGIGAERDRAFRAGEGS